MNEKKIDSPGQIIWLQRIGSTNRYALDNFDALADMTFVLAEEQTGGKGRRGNSWFSPAGINFYGSLIIKNSKCQPHEMVWPGSLAALELLREYSPTSELWLKWPNDIYCGEKKIAGVLCEGKLNTSNRLEGIVFGLGINLNMPAVLLNTIDKPATSLLNETGRSVDIKQFAFELSAKTLSLYELAFSNGLDNFFTLWKRENRLIGNNITIETNNNITYKGNVTDINAKAELVLTTDDGTTHQFNSGEVTIKEGFTL